MSVAMVALDREPALVAIMKQLSGCWPCCLRFALQKTRKATAIAATVGSIFTRILHASVFWFARRFGPRSSLDACLILPLQQSGEWQACAKRLLQAVGDAQSPFDRR